MEGKILDCVNYIKNISKQKLTLEKIFINMKTNDELQMLVKLVKQKFKKRLLL